jgi:hypothetical protein
MGYDFDRKCHRITVFVAQEQWQPILGHGLPEVLSQDPRSRACQISLASTSSTCKV